MSPLEQEKLLEHTRVQIRQHVAEIAELARNSTNGNQFFREFLQRVVASLSAQGGAVWMPGDSGEFQVISEVNFVTSAYHENERQRRDIQRVLLDVVKNRRPFIVGSVAPDVAPPQPSQSADEEIMNTTAYPMFYVPVLVSDQHVGAIIHIWMRAAGDPKTYPTLVNFLNSVAVHASNFMKARQGEAAMARNQEYELMLRCESDLVGELDPKKIGRSTVNHFTDLFHANRCSLFHRVGARWRLEYVSNQETIDQRSELVERLCSLAALLPAAERPAALSLDDPGEAPAEWGPMLESLGTRQVSYAFFQPHAHEGNTGLVMLERHAANTPFTPVGLRQLQWASRQLSRAMVAATTHREIPLRRVLQPVTSARGLWKRRQRLRLAAWIGVPLVLLALWLLVPWTLRVEGDCTVEPKREVTVAAETPGKIERVFVQEGQYVEKGTLLAQLEDEDLRTQIAVAMQDLSKWQAEAYRFQSIGDEAQRKLADISGKSARAKIDRLHYQQEHTELRAPISGVVLTKNLANRVGETLDLGRPFCQLAERDVYEVQIDLKQQDLGVLLQALRQHADLPVDFILYAHTATRLRTFIHGVDSIGETAHVKPGGSFFQVRGDFPVDSALANSLKPGYTGKAKIELGRRSLAAVMMRKFFDYWRVEWML